ncbi:hypothetical protein [Roseospira navarrensis]|uniref:Uncharacterized protein n=1 Tax=Roseospira navarrensis TaxID=140058 RepID=A0A7X2D4E7_9PROT|nr:hypothetical protein [Roseospira navarrensis]MQX37868.1 hypothetical protein [Roseospira navarrensis]
MPFVTRDQTGRIIRQSSMATPGAEWLPEDHADLAPGLARARIEAATAIDRAAEAVRLTYVTAGDGQAAEYRLTAEEAARARVVLNAGGTLDPADYPHLDAEVRAGGAASLAQAVALVEAQSEAWSTISADIKQVRRAGKLAVAAAADLAAIEAARDQALAALATLHAPNP